MRRGWAVLVLAAACRRESPRIEAAPEPNVPPANDAVAQAAIAPCPSVEPSSSTKDAAACTVEGLECEYGPSPRVGCNAVWVCSNARFVLVSQTCDTTPATKSACPKSALAAGASCSSRGDVCALGPDVECRCKEPRTGPALPKLPPPQWSCVTRPASCHDPRPRLGAPCRVAEDACFPWWSRDLDGGLSAWTLGCERCPKGAHGCVDGFVRRSSAIPP